MTNTAKAEMAVSPLSAGAQRMPPADRGAAPPMAPRHEVASAPAGSGNALALGAADLLCLAAAPTFAIMAVLTYVLGSGAPDMLCADASPLGGMLPMYVLMSAFHLAPWLRLVSGRGSRARRS
jgi:hypothetical protein